MNTLRRLRLLFIRRKIRKADIYVDPFGNTVISPDLANRIIESIEKDMRDTKS